MFNPWRGLRGLPSDVWIIFATSLVNRAGMMALPFLVLYLTKYQHVSASVAGLSISAYGIGGMITAPFAGRLCDRIGPFAVMRGSLTLTGLVLLVIPLAHGFPLILALTFLWAVVADATRPATMSALTGTTSPEQRKAAIAVNRLAVNLGMSVGPAVGGLLATVSFPLLFVVDGLTSLAAALVLTILLRSRDRAASLTATGAQPHAVEAQRPSRGRSSVVWQDRRALSFYFAMLVIGMVFMQNQSSMPLYIVRDLHYRESFYGLLFVLNTLLIVALEVPLNLAMAHWSHRRALMLGMLLTAIGFGAMGLSHGVLAIAVTVVIWTFGEMVTFPVGTAYVADIAPPGRNGEYMGAFSSTISMSMVIGPWAGAAALDRFGPSLMWSGVFFCGMIATGVVALSKEPAAQSVDARIPAESTS